MKPLYVLWHLGLGDAILCNGLIRTLANRHGHIIIPCYPHNYGAVSVMFRDDTRIQAVIAMNSTDAAAMATRYENRLMLGFYAENAEKDFNRVKFDQEFYRQANVPFSDRWEAFKLPPLTLLLDVLPPCVKPYSIVHHDLPRGFCIKYQQCGSTPLFIEPSRPFFDWLPYIRHAEEVHCINSSVLILWDSFPHVEGQKLFLHHYARPTDYPALKKNWTLLK